MGEKSEADKTDLRVIKTLGAIQRAFERLLETTDYSNITVSAIAREAQVSRKTFYAHYTSVSDLLKEMMGEIVKRVVNDIQVENDCMSIEEWVRDFTRATLSALRDNPTLESNLARCVPTATLIDMAKQPLLEIFEKEMRARNIPVTPDSEYMTTFYLGGICAIYESWVASHQPPSALDDAASFLSKTIAPGIEALGAAS